MAGLTDQPARNFSGSAALAAKGHDLRSVLSAWASGLADSTATTYAADLECFARFCQRERDEALQWLFSMPGPQANAIVLLYREHLEGHRQANGKPYSTALVCRRLSALRSVSRIARVVGLFRGEIEISGPAIFAVRDTRGPGPEIVGRMVRLLEAQANKGCPAALRDLAIVRLLHDCALRRVEVVRLHVEDVSPSELQIKPKGPRAAVAIVPMPRACSAAVRAWLDVVAGSGPLFPGRAAGSPIAPSTINRMIARRGAEVGDPHVRPHGLRHTAITTALDLSGGDVRAAASLARHRNPSTTLRYDDRAREAARELAEKIAP